MSRTCASPCAATVMDIQGEEQHVEDGWAGVSDAPLTGSRTHTRALTHARTQTHIPSLAHMHGCGEAAEVERDARGNQCKAHQRLRRLSGTLNAVITRPHMCWHTKKDTQHNRPSSSPALLISESHWTHLETNIYIISKREYVVCISMRNFYLVPSVMSQRAR